MGKSLQCKWEQISNGVTFIISDKQKFTRFIQNVTERSKACTYINNCKCSPPRFIYYVMKSLATMQPSAYHQIRFQRFFAITSLWPPMYSRHEIENTIRRYYVKPRKHTERINYLLENNIT
ncbi:CLUMA_CG001590, isoform A [Clunio marinus]|uniref:CLUMA_CG001590, isoform A n=1 Tax=Clunio marinus TaxID=568069 RepID=A0A1J1HIR2_9DIPT|nr:CLUMA_CG001590, isoform A [Clunio marinus]